MWNLARPEIVEETSGLRTALVAQEPSSGPEVTLHLELPDGEVEWQILRGLAPSEARHTYRISGQRCQKRKEFTKMFPDNDI